MTPWSSVLINVAKAYATHDAYFELMFSINPAWEIMWIKHA